jgi:hypothetical protein
MRGMFPFETVKSEKKILTDCLGKVEFWIKGKKSLGSGSLVKTLNTPVIATAAHCLFDWEYKEFYEKVNFYPYVGNFKTSLSPVISVIPKIWADVGAVEYDTGFLVLSESIDLIEYNKYAIPVKFNLSNELSYSIAGFQNKIIPSRKPIISKGKAQKDLFKNSTLQGINSKGKSGMSGGPWISYQNSEYFQNSVSSMSFKSLKNMLWGPYWGDTIKSAYEVAIGSKQTDPRVLIHEYKYQ